MFGDIRGSREAGRSSAWSTSGSRGRGRALRDHAAQGWCSLQEIGGRYDQGSVYVSRISGTLRKVVLPVQFHPETSISTFRWREHWKNCSQIRQTRLIPRFT